MANQIQIVISGSEYSVRNLYHNAAWPPVMQCCYKRIRILGFSVSFGFPGPRSLVLGSTVYTYPCFLSPGENLASEGGRLLLLILIILLF